MKKRIFPLICFLLTFSLLLCACGKGGNGGNGGNSGENSSSNGAEDVEIETADVSGMDFAYSNRDTDASYDENSATRIVFSQTGAEISGSGAVADGADVTVNAEGTYLISGSSSDARLTVDTAKTAKVQLVLCGVSLTSSDGPAMYIRTADKVFLTLAPNSENSLSDASSYSLTDDGTTLDAALFSKEDLTVNGTGSLTVNGNYKHGIVSKDDLVITGGVLEITSANVGLCGKDCVKIGGGTLTVDAGSDGIRSDNDTDTDRGYIYISGGTLDITAANDGVQAETVLKIDDVNMTLLCGGGSSNASMKDDGSWNPMWGGGSSSSSSDSESTKGLKAGSDILIAGGAFTVDSADDCIHSNGTIQISDGTFSMRSGDDGIHADTALAIAGGTVNIGKSYEGLEGSSIAVSGGNISLVASDDGLNAAGGNDGSSMGGRPGQGSFSSSTGAIVISGGYLLVNASGDGIDSNGTFAVSGGVTLVSGPTNNGNGAFDYDSSATVTGGVLIALGTSGMAQGFTSAQNQGALLCSFTSQQADTSLTLCDEDGNAVVSFTPPKAYQSAVITAPGLQSGNDYTLVAGGTVANADANGYAENSTVTGGSVVASISMTSNLYGSSGGGMGGMGGMPGGHGGRPR